MNVIDSDHSRTPSPVYSRTPSPPSDYARMSPSPPKEVTFAEDKRNGEVRPRKRNEQAAASRTNTEQYGRSKL
jgi:hypothetical protein